MRLATPSRPPDDARVEALDRYLRDIAAPPIAQTEVVRLCAEADAASAEGFALVLRIGLPLPGLIALFEDLERGTRRDQCDVFGEDRNEAQLDTGRRAVALERELANLWPRPDEDRLEAVVEERREVLATMRMQRSVLAPLLRDLGSRPVGRLPEGPLRARYEEGRDALALALDRAQAAHRRMVVGNLRLVVATAKRYARRGVPLADLIQEGNIALMRAVEKYDPSRGTRLSTYAMWWIRQALYGTLSDDSRTIRVPRNIATRMIAADRTRHRMTTRDGQEPSAPRLAAELGLSERELRGLQRASVATVSLQSPVHPAHDVTHEEMVVDDRAHHAVETALESRQLATLLLGRLRARDRRVLVLRFGLEGHEPHTLAQIGTELGLTRERVRQIEQAALVRLRRVLDGDRGL